MVLTLLREAGVVLKLKKFALFTNSVDYLGHVIRSGLLEIANHTTVAVGELKVPKTVTELRSFL